MALNGSSVATLEIDNPAVGPHNYTAVYSGDTNFLTSTSVKSVVTVKKANTTTTLTPSAGTSVVHDVPFDLTAAVALVAPGDGTPTGSVVFKEGSTVLGTIASRRRRPCRAHGSIADVPGHAQDHRNLFGRRQRQPVNIDGAGDDSDMTRGSPGWKSGAFTLPIQGC